MDPEDRWIPLFPLSAVLLPGALLPLHIFEPRYKAMIARCEAERIPFGVVQALNEKVAQVGCEAWIERFLERYPDGRCDLVTRGGARIALSGLREHDDGYLEANVQSIDDLTEGDDPETRADLLKIYAEYRRLLDDEAEPAVPDPGDLIREAPAGYTFALASQSGMDVPERQAFLEIVSERKREEFLLRHLAQMLPRAGATGETRGRVRGNGKLKPKSP